MLKQTVERLHLEWCHIMIKSELVLRQIADVQYPRTADMRKAEKCPWLKWPTQLFIHGQWWSIRLIHLLQIRQWCDIGGLNVWHCPHMECESFKSRWRSLGMAASGTLPGSVRLVLAWQANAMKHKML